MADPTPTDRRSPMEHERDARSCPLGEDCDLTVAWMAGQAEARDSYRARIEDLTAQLGLARIDADQQRARAEAAGTRARDLWAAMEEVRGLVAGANHARERYPRAWAELMGGGR